MRQKAVEVLLLTLCVVMVITNLGINVYCSYLTNTERQTFLDAHNYFRLTTASGKTAGYQGVLLPSAARMSLLFWDDDLEAAAQRDADTCIFRHTVNETKIATFPKGIGQNLYKGGMAGLGSAIKAFHDESVNYIFGKLNSQTYPGVVGHFTQVNGDRSHAVGCGLNKSCNYVVCNYGPGANLVGAFTYISGDPCSQCESGYNWCVNDKLCATSEYCKLTESQCTCKIRCQNGGTVDPTTCTCQCQPGFYSTFCELPCVDSASWCSWASVTDATKYGSYCKLKFKLCNTVAGNPVFKNSNKIFPQNYQTLPST